MTKAAGFARQLTERAAKISGEQPGKHEWYGHADARLDNAAATLLASQEAEIAELQNAEEQLAIRAGAWKQQATILGERVAALEGLRATIAVQKLPSELSDDQFDSADWQGAYETIVSSARALRPAETGGGQ